MLTGCVVNKQLVCTLLFQHSPGCGWVPGRDYLIHAPHRQGAGFRDHGGTFIHGSRATTKQNEVRKTPRAPTRKRSQTHQRGSSLHSKTTTVISQLTNSKYESIYQPQRPPIPPWVTIHTHTIPCKYASLAFPLRIHGLTQERQISTVHSLQASTLPSQCSHVPSGGCAIPEFPHIPYV